MMEIFDCEQGSPEWHRCRLGVPSASMFKTILAEGKDGGASKTRRDYLLRLAGEILTDEPSETYSNDHMERGKVMEDEARNLYAFTNDCELVRVGFIRNGLCGCSPDSLIDSDGGLEIKTAIPHIQIDRLLRDRLPPEHKAQVQGNLMVTGRKWWDFCSYWPKLPLLAVRIERDEPYIEKLTAAVKDFAQELDFTVQRIRRYGTSPAERKVELTELLAAG